MKKLVAYFSATGVTAQIAEALAEAVGADVFEIRPKDIYTKADLNWWEKTARSTIEMDNPTSRPALARGRDNMSEYDIIFVGFPIWWNAAPRIINTFLESYDFSGKIIIPFATSASSGVDKVRESIQGSCKGAELKIATLVNAQMSYADLAMWAEKLLAK